MPFKLKFPFTDAAGQLDAGAAVGFTVAVLVAVMALRALPVTAKLVK